MIVGACWALVCVGVYWLCCTQLGIDLKGVFTTIKDPGETILTILVIVYWVLIVPYIEEWFWREWMWENLYIDRIVEKIWVALTWGSMYAVFLFMASGASAGIACGVALAIFGYVLAPIIRYEWGYNSEFLIHMGCNGGAAICWYLAGTGKF